MFCVVDIESTGGKFEEEAIIEIALYKYDGHKIVDQFISLVNPEGVEIQPYVSKLTGITPGMVKRAPKFYELAKRVIDITSNNVLVAHNAPFDYRILQNEFSRLGYDFTMPTLDTIPWAQKLIPGLPAYGLEKLSKSLGINHNNKHRAADDARATVDLLKILIEKDHAKDLISMAFHEDEHNHPFKKIILPLKNVTGIYYLLNKKGKVIFVGRSNFLKNKIDRHFMANNPKAIELQNEVYDINVEETGNEIISRIKEYTLWKKLKPKYNSKKFDFLLPYCLIKTNDGLSLIKSEVNQKALWYFQGRTKAYAACAVYCKSNKIEPYKIFPAIHAKRIEEHVKLNQIEYTKKWSWSDIGFEQKNFVLELKGRKPLEKCVILVKNNLPKGYAYLELQTQIDDIALLEKLLSPFSRDVYIKSLVAYAIAENKFVKIKAF